MYCPHCGAESATGLKFCKRCGASLAQTGNPPAPANVPVKLTGMFLLAITAVTIIGFMMAIIAPSELAHKYSDGLIGMIVVLSILMAIGIDLLLVWLLLHLIKLSHGVMEATQSNVISPAAHTPAQVAAPLAGVLSVTEHTTRNFEPVSDAGSNAEEGRAGQRSTR
ncbi:MAG TPA: zinc ribbon domain-containing protein [Blastocatellia bacterium]|nr:zinc ribbon domain-containing protein [Blastocatellia bacterium]